MTAGQAVAAGESARGRKDQLLHQSKAEAARDHWFAAVNNHGGLGRWGYVEISNMDHAHSALDNAIAALLAVDPGRRWHVDSICDEDAGGNFVDRELVIFDVDGHWAAVMA
ncbi:MAG: hypothetical protein ABIR32_06870 [Ilumatobacteraceae bacterium]